MATDVVVPMVGKILSVNVKEGDQVQENDQIALMEAMKMEIPVMAPASGTVTKLNIAEGQTVDTDVIIAVIE